MTYDPAKLACEVEGIVSKGIPIGPNKLPYERPTIYCKQAFEMYLFIVGMVRPPGLNFPEPNVYYSLSLEYVRHLLISEEWKSDGSVYSTSGVMPTPLRLFSSTDMSLTFK